jgi:hypothetical protein
MPSAARKAFDANLKDVRRLIDFHEEKSGTSRGRRYGLEVLNKSAIVLLCACWEAYCEDIASEALEFIVKHANSADQLPTDLKKSLLKSLSESKHELEVWRIADSGWRTVATDRMAALREARAKRLNTPKSAQIDDLFRSAIGINSVSSEWKITPRTTADKTRKKLDHFVSLRGEIAHRSKADTSVKKADVMAFAELIHVLAAKTGGTVNKFVFKAVGRTMWRRKSKGKPTFRQITASK